jgi:hypothetical protein
MLQNLCLIVTWLVGGVSPLFVHPLDPASPAAAQGLPPAPELIAVRLDANGITPPFQSTVSYSWNGQAPIRLRFQNTADVALVVNVDLPLPSPFAGLDPVQADWPLAQRSVGERTGLRTVTCQPDTRRCVAEVTILPFAFIEFLLSPFLELAQAGPGDVRFVVSARGATVPPAYREGRLYFDRSTTATDVQPPPPAPTVSQLRRADGAPAGQTSQAQRYPVAPPAPAPAPPPPPPPPVPVAPTLTTDLYLACPLEPFQNEIELALDNTGWSGYAYQNRRSPPNILESASALEPRARLLENQLQTYGTCLQDKIDTLEQIPADKNSDAQRLLASLLSEQDRLRKLTRVPERLQFAAARVQALRIQNTTFDRTFSVAFTIREPIELESERFPTDANAREAYYAAARAAFESSRGIHIDSCKVPDKTCDVLVTIPPLGFARVSSGVLFPLSEAVARDANAKALPVELVATFFNVDLKPAYGSAYLSTVDVDRLIEPASKTSWSVTASVTGQLVPDTPAGASYSTTRPYETALLRSYGGSGVLTLAQTLGNRAAADVNLTYQSGVFGSDASTDRITASSYKVTVNSFKGATLTFGRFLVASPSNGLGGRDEGDAIRYALGHLAAALVIKRESSAFKPNQWNRDDKALIVEATNLTRPTWRLFRFVNLYASFGRNGDVLAPDEAKRIAELKARHTELEAAEAEVKALESRERLRRRYVTAGGEVVFAPSRETYGTVAIYKHYYREAGLVLADRPFRKGSGLNALATGSYTFFGAPPPTGPRKQPVVGTLTLQLGLGSSDDRDSPTTDESFMGQTAAFAPDAIYLSRFANKLDLESDSGTMKMPTLANKHYAALGFTRPGWSLARGLVWLLRVPARDVDYQATILWLRYYRFSREVFDANNAGLELFSNSQVTSPKGVETSIQLGKFWRYKALESVLRPSPWTAAINVTVKLVN